MQVQGQRGPAGGCRAPALEQAAPARLAVPTRWRRCSAGCTASTWSGRPTTAGPGAALQTWSAAWGRCSACAACTSWPSSSPCWTCPSCSGRCARASPAQRSACGPVQHRSTGAVHSLHVVPLSGLLLGTPAAALEGGPRALSLVSHLDAHVASWTGYSQHELPGCQQAARQRRPPARAWLIWTGAACAL